MRIRKATRGEPLVALCVVLGAWIGVRAMFWDDAWLAPAASAEGARLALEIADGAVEGSEFPDDASRIEDAEPVPLAQSGGGEPPDSDGLRRCSGVAPPSLTRPVRFVRVAGQHVRRTGMLRRLQFELPSGVMSFRLAPGSGATASSKSSKSVQEVAVKAAAPERNRHHRWSGDGWLLLRPGASGLLSAGTAPSTYGASQMGAVLRYRFAPESRYRPAAYLRTTAALDGVERDIALGASSRILPWLPVIAQAEVRASQRVGKTRLRPAALLVSELAPFALPQKLRGEAYAQAGYVGGRFATPFVDGQMRVDRGALPLGRAELRAGAGIWGGAQQGAARVDLGPSATVGIPLGRSASARVALDWRFRIAGNAAPASGPAITLSAGF